MYIGIYASQLLKHGQIKITPIGGAGGHSPVILDFETAHIQIEIAAEDVADLQEHRANNAKATGNLN